MAENGAKEAGQEERRKAACERLMESLAQKHGGTADETRQALWNAVLAFEGAPFSTLSGLEFSYSVKMTRRGEKGKELLVSRKEKTITRSSVEAAFDRLLELKGEGEFPVPLKGPRQLGTFGASYLYPLFICFGLVKTCHGNE